MRGTATLIAVSMIAPSLAIRAGAMELRCADPGWRQERRARDAGAEFDRRMKELEKRLHAMREQSRERFARALADLRRRRMILQRRLSELGTSADAAWKRLRKDLEATLEDLRRDLEAPPPPDVTET
jgi:DNA anti-recombination protein RmuC